MALFRKECLEALKGRIDLVEVVGAYVELKRTGAAFKALCPFHDEKTPSFTIQKGDTHYHCYGCGAHGDAIAFLMNQQRLSFVDAVEALAHRFGVHMEKVEAAQEERGPSKVAMREALQQAALFYHFWLLHTDEGHRALGYLYDRGIDLSFIRRFMLGLAPNTGGAFIPYMHSKGFNNEVIEAAGLLSAGRYERFRDFFQERITVPIHHPTGHIIGFTARKYREETFGGKYINTTETTLFKKSKVLFGLHYCRRRIAKERRAIIVEGQIDCLRLIHEGFGIAVASQGTAFGEGHAAELLTLGVQEVFLAFDSDNAGQQAAAKVGQIMQKGGVEVRVVKMAEGCDPDTFLRKEGPEAFEKLLFGSPDYLTFIVGWMGCSYDLKSPAGKNGLAVELVKQIRSWNNPLMVHESLRKVAALLQVPEEMVGVGQEVVPNTLIRKTASVAVQETIDPDRILETDFLRWLILMSGQCPHFVSIARVNVDAALFRVDSCRALYRAFRHVYNDDNPVDLLQLAIQMDNDGEASTLINEIMSRKVNRDKAEELFVATVQRLLDRQWMEQREKIKMRIQSGVLSDDEALVLVKQFEELKNNPPKVANSHKV